MPLRFGTFLAPNMLPVYRPGSAVRKHRGVVAAL